MMRNYHILVGGGTQIHSCNAKFCERLGQKLAKEEHLIIVTGGFKHFYDKPNGFSSDWSTIKGVLNVLKKAGISPETRIKTLLPGHDSSSFIRFEEGETIILHDQNPRSRRFSMVNLADAIVSIQGGKGTQEVLELAVVTKKPILPLPFTLGISQKKWTQHRTLIQEQFRMKEIQAQFLETIDLQHMSDQSLDELAETIVQYLAKSVKEVQYDVFLSYAREDIDKILPIYDILFQHNINVWLDVKNLLPGQDWEYHIQKQIRESSIFIACLSQNSVNKSGYFQKELKRGLDICDEYPEDQIYMIPVRLEPCEIPERFKKFQWCDVFKSGELEKLILAIEKVYYEE